MIPVIIPAYEPDERLTKLISELIKLDITPIILVNDGSNKKYDYVFSECESLLKVDNKGIILTHNINMGKGKALKTAFTYILEKYPNAIGCVTADSDGQHTPKCINKCINSLKKYSDHLILGTRNFDLDNVPIKSRLGNKITRNICKYLCGLSISDTQTGLRGIPLDFMKKLINVPGDRFEFETQMLIETKNVIDIKEVKIETVYDSIDNHSTHFDPIKDSIRIYKIFGKIFAKFLVSSVSSFIIDIVLFNLFCILLKNNIDGTIYAGVATILARIISAV